MNEGACFKVLDVCHSVACKHADASCPQVRSTQKLHKLYFPDGDGPTVTMQMNKAVEICMTCPVWVECLEWAAASPHSWQQGVYGGLKPGERTTTIDEEPDIEAALRYADLKYLAHARKKGVA